MPLFTWDEKYDVRVQAMNVQHQKLFDLINQLHDAMSAGKAKAMLNQVLDELLDYTRTHFTAEEKLLEKFQFPNLEDQKNEHTVFIKKMVDLQQQNQAGSLTVTLETSKFLKDWLMNHIMIEDKKYSSFLNSKGQN